MKTIACPLTDKEIADIDVGPTTEQFVEGYTVEAKTRTIIERSPQQIKNKKLLEAFNELFNSFRIHGVTAADRRHIEKFIAGLQMVSQDQTVLSEFRKVG